MITREQILTDLNRETARHCPPSGLTAEQITFNERCARRIIMCRPRSMERAWAMFVRLCEGRKISRSVTR